MPFAVSAGESPKEWFALLVKPRHEKVTEQVLANKGLETFLPLRTRLRRYGSRQRQSQLPLFPGYLFCRFDPQASLLVLSTPSVNRVVGAGRRPLPVDTTEME